MSSNQTSDNAAFIQDYERLLIENYCSFAAYAFLLYEHLITMEQEVRLFWRHKANGATMLFFSNRFLVFATFTLSTFASISMSEESCTLLSKTFKAVNILMYLPWAVFSALRTFALSQNWPLATLVFLLSLVTLIVNYVGYFAYGTTGVNDPVGGCTLVNSISASLGHITTYKTATLGDALRTHSSFGEVLLRDGLIYFIAHLICTLLALGPTTESTSYVTVFTEPITAVIVSRFLLNLQAAHRDAMNGGLSTLNANQGESIVFDRIAVLSWSAATEMEDLRSRMGTMMQDRP
ncbi:hypothetical protein C8Q80DRAFT_1124772 [Daedaleopsis nitida]|nr:hypothetical protein C8Q80DRAFT_1124772 [Daedaleopsis nitida]